VRHGAARNGEREALGWLSRTVRYGHSGPRRAEKAARIGRAVWYKAGVLQTLKPLTFTTPFGPPAGPPPTTPNLTPASTTLVPTNPYVRGGAASACGNGPMSHPARSERSPDSRDVPRWMFANLRRARRAPSWRGRDTPPNSRGAPPRAERHLGFGSACRTYAPLQSEREFRVWLPRAAAR
jgi:hypothetical protein